MEVGVDAAEAKMRVAARLQAVLEAVAKEKRCAPDDLSVGLVRELENFGLWCIYDGYTTAHEEPTQKIPIFPGGVWKDKDNEK